MHFLEICVFFDQFLLAKTRKTYGQLDVVPNALSPEHKPAAVFVVVDIYARHQACVVLSLRGGSRDRA